ncbi:MAG: putative dsRNA-binding protein, partial [Candidatus Sungiibacteriota bacterium]
MYLDQGYGPVRDFIMRVVLSRMPEVLDKKLYKDPKSLFQEEAQERMSITPTYEVRREWGPDHDRHFVIGAFLRDELVAEGEGPSKQIAQEEAARNALHAKGWV